MFSAIGGWAVNTIEVTHLALICNIYSIYNRVLSTLSEASLPLQLVTDDTDRSPYHVSVSATDMLQLI